MNEIRKKLLFFNKNVKSFEKPLKLEIKFNPFYYSNKVQSLFEEIFKNYQYIKYTHKFQMSKNPLIENTSIDSNVKNIELTIKNLFIEEFLIWENSLEFLSILNKINIDKQMFWFSIKCMELGSFLSFLIKMKEHHFISKNIFTKSLFSKLQKTFFKNYKPQLLFLFNDQWDSFFEFLLLFIIFRNALFHPNYYDINLLISTEELIKFISYSKKLKAKEEITITKNENENLNIVFQKIDYFSIISNSFDHFIKIFQE